MADNVISKSFYVIFFLIACLGGSTTKAQTTQRPAILGVSHVILKVSKTEDAITFYGKLLGYKGIRQQKPGKGENVSYSFVVNERQTIFLQDGLAPDQEERLLEVGFETSDAEALRKYLQAKGWPVPPVLSREKRNSLSFLLSDPDGHQIKFIQHLGPKATISINRNPKDIRISGRILHVGLQVTNQQAANKFYQDALGFSEIWRGGRTDTETSWINMRVPDGTDYLEYMLTPGKVSKQQLGVLHHLALLVPEMQKALDVLRQRAVPLNYGVPAPGIGRNNRWQLNLYDPDGTRVELMEPFTFR